MTVPAAHQLCRGGRHESTIIDLYGLDNFEFTYGMAGRTDTYIARKAIEGIQGRCTPEEVTRMLQAYGKKLPASLVEKQGHLLPHVKETLEWIRQDPDTTSLLLTGNCEVAAHAKLAYFGIEEEFDYSRSASGKSASSGTIFPGPVGQGAEPDPA